MALSTEVLFDRPQQEIASLIERRITQCASASLVAGFATLAGIDRVAGPLLQSPHKLNHLVVGAGTYSAFEGFDSLIAGGVPPDRLMVHLGMSRKRGAAVFERYRPMLHSKIYLLDMGSDHASAFVGSHNLTAFALGGLNGEAGIFLEGDSNEAVFRDLRRHVAASVTGAIQYDPAMKDAYAWWTKEYFDGLRIEANDAPTDAEARRTVVIIAELVKGRVPKQGEIVYFEALAALNEARSLDMDIHLYLFDKLPGSPEIALQQLSSAQLALACKSVGVEARRGAIEVDVDWHISDPRNPKLQVVQRPFRPQTPSDRHQVRAEVASNIMAPLEYLFDGGRTAWTAILDTEEGSTKIPMTDFLKVARRRKTEEGDWYRVRELVPADKPVKKEVAIAMKEAAPGSGSYLLLAPRRRRLSPMR